MTAISSVPSAFRLPTNSGSEIRFENKDAALPTCAEASVSHESQHPEYDPAPRSCLLDFLGPWSCFCFSHDVSDTPFKCQTQLHLFWL